MCELERIYRTGNQREHLQMIRTLLDPLRMLLRRLSATHTSNNSQLRNLAKLGIIVPGKVHYFVSTAAFGDTAEIFSPLEHLRQIWKPVAKDRRAPEDGDRPRRYTKSLWSTSLRVRDCHYPPISTEELQATFGPTATYAPHQNERLPFESGASKSL